MRKFLSGILVGGLLHITIAIVAAFFTLIAAFVSEHVIPLGVLAIRFAYLVAPWSGLTIALNLKKPQEPDCLACYIGFSSSFLFILFFIVRIYSPSSGILGATYAGAILENVN